MASKRKLDGLNYRQAQKRNSDKFKSFDKATHKELRNIGYKNLGWDNVEKSWNIIQGYIPLPIDLVDFARKKAEIRYRKAKDSNNLNEVLDAGKSLISSLKMKYQ